MAEEKSIRLVGSKFTKLSAERNPNFDGSLSLKTDISIKNLEKFKPEGTKQESLKIEYQFKIDYADLGNIIIEGILFIVLDSKTQKDALKDWKIKKLNSPTYMAMMNLIMQKASLKAFELEDELGLPIHIKLPLLQAKKEE